MCKSEKLVCVFCGKEDKPAGTTLTINCHPDNICFTDAAKNLRVCHKCRKSRVIGDLYRYVMDAIVAEHHKDPIIVCGHAEEHVDAFPPCGRDDISHD